MDKNKLTPMMKQYLEIKENTKDALVFYRLGDFYELFLEDAITASKVLDLVLTSRNAGQNQKVPMAGVPHHAAKSYIQKLINHGYKVAIVEQVEDPKEAKGIVKREVVEVVTPGTFIEDEEVLTREVAAIHSDLVYATIVLADIAAGTLRSIRIMNDPIEIIKTLEQFEVSELVVDSSFDQEIIQTVKDKTAIHISYQEESYKNITHEDMGVEKALQKLYAYIRYTQKRDLNHFGKVKVLNDQAYLIMDYATITNLELNQHHSSKDLSLYSFLNHTQTTMGARRLKDELMQPMVDKNMIVKRQNQIQFFIDNMMIKDDLQALLKETYDIHRVVARLSTDKNNAQDFVRLKNTIKVFNEIKELLILNPLFESVVNVTNLKELADLIERSIHDDAPVQLKEGRTFKKGVDKELDELISITTDGKKWLLEYEENQRNLTGIKNLKVGYTRAFGYYIEISKGQVENVKDSHGYIRRQTLTNAERYISEELQEYET
ncbi:MAG: DNA mismatch repair protein MutS, partial [Erysipelothrix sp.]|nr:DNA mismatch repair protein MutS [Erysipelothrix sp.]